MPHILWLWKPCYLHEALQTEICGCWKSWPPFSMGGMVMEHCAMSLGLPEQWEHRVTWGPPQLFPTGGWQLQNSHILIPQQRFLLCLAFFAMRWDWGLKIPIERRNIEFQNIEKQIPWREYMSFVCCQNTMDTVQSLFCSLLMCTLYNPCTQIWHATCTTQQNTEQQRMLARAHTKESLFLQVIKLHFAK